MRRDIRAFVIGILLIICVHLNALVLSLPSFGGSCALALCDVFGVCRVGPIVCDCCCAVNACYIFGECEPLDAFGAAIDFANELRGAASENCGLNRSSKSFLPARGPRRTGVQS